MIIRIGKIKNRPLARLAKTLKVTEVERLGSKDTKYGVYELYKVGSILAIAIHQGIITEWDAGFESMWKKHFSGQTNGKGNT